MPPKNKTVLTPPELKLAQNVALQWEAAYIHGNETDKNLPSKESYYPEDIKLKHSPCNLNSPALSSSA